MNNPQKDLIFALDIGTRSVIGIVGEARGEMFHVLYMAKQEHSRRAMVDGQIEDIEQVAKVVTIVKERLEEQVGHALTRVCVAAAGRSLRMERARAVVELPEIHTITDELISQLEAVAIAEAEEKLSEHNKDQRFYLVGYTVAQYILDRYPMTTIKGHNGQTMEADVVATFLPSQVVEGLYSVVQISGMEVASLTLEPIAALNATIPPDLRLLNLVLVDIGAGTSDIAVCRDGSVVGYTMATTAGDEITEMLMKHFLVDFNTAEHLKTNLNAGDLKYVDVLGLEQNTTGQNISEAVAVAAKSLVKEIAKQIQAINGCAPSAIFMAGGGSKLDGITKLLAESLELAPHRIAVAGNNYNRTIVAENFQLEDPEYATPLGIAVSAGLGLINDSYHITLNGKGAKLFRSGSLTILDILMMNGFTAAALIGRTGKNLALMINGNKKIIRGKPSIPGILRLNGEATVAGALVSAGDSIEFVPAIDGMSASCTLQELLGDYAGHVLLNGKEAPWDSQLRSGDAITTVTSPMQYSRKHRPHSAEEMKPVDADGNPLMSIGEDVFYQEVLSEQTGQDVESLSGAVPYSDGVPPEVPVELPSIRDVDEDMKIYATEQPLELEETPSEVPALEPTELPSPTAEETEEQQPEALAPLTRDYHTPEEIAVPMPVSEPFEVEDTAPTENITAFPSSENLSSYPENEGASPFEEEQSTQEQEEPEELEPLEEPTPLKSFTSEPEDNLPPVIRMTEEFEKAAMEALGAKTAVPIDKLEEIQQTLGDELSKMVAEHEANLATKFTETSEEPVETPAIPKPQEVPSSLGERRVPIDAPESAASAVESPDGGKPPLTEGRIVLNGSPVQLTAKVDGSPYYLMDLLDKTDIDFRNVTKPIRMLVNGKEGYFVQQIHENDDVVVEEQE